MRGFALPVERAVVLRPGFGARPLPRVAALVAAAVVVVAAVTTHRFLTWDNVKAIFNSASLVGIMALGLTFVTLVGAIASLAVAQTAVVAAMVFLSTLGLGLVPALVLAVLVGAAVTGLQGLLIGAWNANPVILTIGAGFLIDGFAQAVHGGSIVQPAGGGVRHDPWPNRVGKRHDRQFRNVPLRRAAVVELAAEANVQPGPQEVEFRRARALHLRAARLDLN